MKMFAVAFNLTRSPPEKNNASANESLARSNNVDFFAPSSVAIIEKRWRIEEPGNYNMFLIAVSRVFLLMSVTQQQVMITPGM